MSSVSILYSILLVEEVFDLESCVGNVYGHTQVA